MAGVGMLVRLLGRISISFPLLPPGKCPDWGGAGSFMCCAAWPLTGLAGGGVVVLCVCVLGGGGRAGAARRHGPEGPRAHHARVSQRLLPRPHHHGPARPRCGEAAPLPLHFLPLPRTCSPAGRLAPSRFLSSSASHSLSPAPAPATTALLTYERVRAPIERRVARAGRAFRGPRPAARSPLPLAGVWLRARCPMRCRPSGSGLCRAQAVCLGGSICTWRVWAEAGSRARVAGRHRRAAGVAGHQLRPAVQQVGRLHTHDLPSNRSERQARTHTNKHTRTGEAVSSSPPCLPRVVLLLRVRGCARARRTRPAIEPLCERARTRAR